jgi:hypothetical protein
VEFQEAMGNGSPPGELSTLYKLLKDLQMELALAGIKEDATG